MNKFLYLAAFVVAIVLAYASAEGQNQSQTSQPGQQATQPDRRTQNTPGQPAVTRTPSQGSSSAINVPDGGVAGAAGSTTGKTEVPETPQPASAPLSDSDLQSQIQNALSKEPTLSGDTVNVIVSAASIEISGSVATAREKLTATRIVDSYAGNRKVISHLTLGEKNRNAAPAAATRPPQ